jgi:hypothetical protein
MWNKFESSIWNNIGNVIGYSEYNIFRICKDILRDMSGSFGRISTMCENKSHM